MRLPTLQNLLHFAMLSIILTVHHLKRAQSHDAIVQSQHTCTMKRTTADVVLADH